MRNGGPTLGSSKVRISSVSATRPIGNTCCVKSALRSLRMQVYRFNSSTYSWRRKEGGEREVVGRVMGVNGVK